MKNPFQKNLPGTSRAPAHSLNRREFMTRTGTLFGASALAGVVLPQVHAAEDNTIRLALIGCGGRGSGAAANALESPNGPVKMIAMADFLENRLANAHKNLTEKYPAQMDVPPDRRFTGFDAWRKAIDCRRPGDVARASNFSFCPNIDQFTADSPPPVQADAQGRYPVPVPGKWVEL